MPVWRFRKCVVCQPGHTQLSASAYPRWSAWLSRRSLQWRWPRREQSAELATDTARALWHQVRLLLTMHRRMFCGITLERRGGMDTHPNFYAAVCAILIINIHQYPPFAGSSQSRQHSWWSDLVATTRRSHLGSISSYLW